MTYKEFIQNIITTRGQWNIPVNEYFEKHHIKPLCLGGEGEYKDGRFKKFSHHPNCIWLYPHEHFVAHKLLMDENPDCYELAYAFSMMCLLHDSPCESNDRHYEVTAEEYAKARTIAVEAMKAGRNANKDCIAVCNDDLHKVKYLRPELVNEFLQANNGWRLGGLKHSDEYKISQSKRLSGKNNPMYGKHLSEKAKKIKSEKISGLIFVNNGEICLRVKPDEIPDGFIKGRLIDVAGEKNPMYGKHSGMSKPIICVETGEHYASGRQAALALNIPVSNITYAVNKNKAVKSRDNKIYSFKFA